VDEECDKLETVKLEVDNTCDDRRAAAKKAARKNHQIAQSETRFQRGSALI